MQERLSTFLLACVIEAAFRVFWVGMSLVDHVIVGFKVGARNRLDDSIGAVEWKPLREPVHSLHK